MQFLFRSVLIHLDAGLCDLSGMCPSSVSSLNWNALPNEDIQCEFCEKVIQHWINTWTANTTEAEFKEVLEALCHKVEFINHLDGQILTLMFRILEKLHKSRSKNCVQMVYERPLR